MMRSVADINAEIRAVVDRLGKERCGAMLDVLGSKGAKPFQREPEPVRVRTSRDAFRRIGNIAKAALYERRLAEIETRAPEPWALDALVEGRTP